MKRAIGWLLLLFALPAGAFEGHDALPGLDSGQVLEDGDFIWFLPVVQDQYKEFGNALDVEPGFRKSAGDGFEFGFSAPYRMDSKSDSQGLRFLRGTAKYQLSATGTSYTALSVYGTLVPADAQQGIGTGHNNLGVAINLTDYSPDHRTGFYSLLGIERTDSRVLLQDGTAAYELVNRFRFGLGVEQRMSENSAFLLQSVVSMANGDQAQNQFGFQVMPGLRFASPHGGFGLTISAGFDLPRNGIEPERQYLVALSYRPREPRLTLRRLAKKVDALQQRVHMLEQQLVVQDARLGKSEVRGAYNSGAIAALKTRTGSMSIEVLNASGVPGLEKKIANKLAARGYHVVRTGAAKQPLRKTTLINYRDGLAKRAIALGHQLKHVQVVTKGKDLPDGIDARLILGADLK